MMRCFKQCTFLLWCSIFVLVTWTILRSDYYKEENGDVTVPNRQNFTKDWAHNALTIERMEIPTKADGAQSRGEENYNSGLSDVPNAIDLQDKEQTLEHKDDTMDYTISEKSSPSGVQQNLSDTSSRDSSDIWRQFDEVLNIAVQRLDTTSNNTKLISRDSLSKSTTHQTNDERHSRKNVTGIDNDPSNSKSTYKTNVNHGELLKVDSQQKPLQSSPKKLNVLFLMADDLRTQIQPYEGKDYLFKQPEMRTPNFQRLAAESLLLNNAFAQYSLCGPSRTSMLTSRRPDTLRVYNNKVYWRAHSGNYATLPQYFKENGYLTLCIGKIFHLGSASNKSDPPSWSEPCYTHPGYEALHLNNSRVSNKVWTPVSDEDILKFPLADMQSVRKTRFLLESKVFTSLKHGRPFFLALGFRRPHPEQVCPQKYFDMYPLENKTGQQNKPRKQTTDIDDDYLRVRRRAYYACVSYVDALLGEVLDTIEELGLKESTIVSFVSDHGYHFGEHGVMGKSTNFDLTTKVPLMLRVPGNTDHGIVSDSVVEAIDIFPTIVEAAGLKPVPSCGKTPRRDVCTEGRSFLSLIDNPRREIKGEAFSEAGGKNGMQYSVRTRRYRLSMWARGRTLDEMQVDTEYGLELYDHINDSTEYNNVAYLPKFSNITRTLSSKILKYFTEQTMK